MVALITGGSSDLGGEIARIFANNGYDIVFTFLKHEEKAFTLQKELEKKVNVLCLKCDINNDKDIENLFLKTKEKFGSIDCLVNNVGIFMDNAFKDKTLDEFKKVIDVNLVGTFNVIKNISKLMTRGVIINISSTDGIDTFYEEEIDYASSKAGINVMTKILASILAPDIRVNAVAPGWIDSDINKDMGMDFKEKQISKILLKRFASPTEIANVVYFLASPKASYINGSIIRVDGGYSC